MSDNQNYNTRLQALEGSSISTVDFPVDIRNRTIKNAAGTEIARVSDLLFDVQSKKVRYAVLEINNPEKRQILTPVGAIDSTGSDTLSISALSDSLISHLPDYIPDQVNPGVENMIRLAYLGESHSEETQPLTGHPEAIDSESFYNNKLFSISHLFNFLRSDDVTRKVEAVFDDSIEAETAITELLAAGFSSDDVEVSSTQAKNVLGDDEVETPEVANGGSLVSIKVTNRSEAEKASEIFNKNGSVSIFENEDK